MGGNNMVVLRGLLLVGFCFFLLFGVSTITRVAVPPTVSVGVSNLKGARRHERLVVNYVSKRRVPNGPDPIHNRKVGSDRQPPERG